MKNILVLWLLMMLPLGVLLAGGQTDAPTPATAASPVAEKIVTGEGVPVTYATPADFTAQTGRTLPPFSEAPMLAAKVGAGELPPVARRVPEEPLVIAPAYEIGTYGGTMRRIAKENYRYHKYHRIFEMPVNYSSSMFEDIPADQIIEPNISKSWTISADARIYTFSLRKGIKWSDGEPFSADAFAFWYNDIGLHEELYPTGYGILKAGGEMATFDKLDDHTIRYTFKEPNSLFIEKFARFRYIPGYAPRHYLEQFHPAYTDTAEVERNTKEAGYQSWSQLFFEKVQSWENPDRPAITSYLSVNTASDPVHMYVRNPYFWKVDTEGNQLPYIDEVYWFKENSEEGRLLKTLAGEVDFVSFSEVGRFKNIAVLKEYEAKNEEFTVEFERSYVGSNGAIYFNLDIENEAKKEIYNDVRFRIAVSHAIDRDEVNAVAFQGREEPSVLGIGHGAPYFGESDRFNPAIEYDVDKANALLDEIGLSWNASRSQRLLPDGKRFQVTIYPDPNLAEAFATKVSEMYVDYMAKIGIKVNIRQVSRELIGQLRSAGELDWEVGHINMGSMRPTFPATRITPIVADSNNVPVRHNGWLSWIRTGGREGEEPPDDYKRMAQLGVQVLSATEAKRRVELEQQIFEIYANNLWVVGATITDPFGKYRVRHNRVRNYPATRPIAEHYNVPSTWYLED